MLQLGSPAISFGTNLTSLGMVTLDSDKAGTIRPASCLDIGRMLMTVQHLL